jgi:hypothetical protein
MLPVLPMHVEKGRRISPSRDSLRVYHNQQQILIALRGRDSWLLLTRYQDDDQLNS